MSEWKWGNHIISFKELLFDGMSRVFFAPGNVTDIVIDIETLSLKNTAVILSIGAAAITESAEPAGLFYERVSVDSCLDKGMTIDADTLAWWFKQSSPFMNIYGGTDIADALCNLFAWMTELGCDGSTVNIWGNGPEFDNAIITNAAYRLLPKSVVNDMLWDYRRNQSVRTLWHINEMLGLGVTYKYDYPKHVAVFDAIVEAEFVGEVKSKLKALVK